MGVSLSQPKQSSGAVFGEVAAQTNGASQESKEPFGYYFTKPQEPQQQASNPSQNLFFQCMTQTQSPGITQGQTKDSNYFTALAKNVSKDPPTIFKPAEGLKKAFVVSASAGLFGSAPAGGMASVKEQPKVPEVKPAGNGILINKSFGTGGEAVVKLAPGYLPAVSNSPVLGSGDISKPASGLGTSLSLGSAVLNSPAAGMRNSTSPSPASGFGLLSGNKGSEPHENLFLAASKEANPFLAYTGAGSNSPFSAPNLSSSVSAAQPSGGTSVLSQDPPAADGQSNLFAMVEPPKGILSSQFASSSSSSSSPASFMSQHKDDQVLKQDEEATNGGTGNFNSESMFADGQAAPIPFDQASQKFSLDERGQSSKRDSDSSSNSDLSDLSEAEDGNEQGENPGMHSGSGFDVQKIKAQAPKNRPRSKSFKGSPQGMLMFSIICFIHVCIGQVT